MKVTKMSEQSVRCEGTVSAECHMENHKATHEKHGVLGKSVSRKEEMSSQTHSSVRSCLLLGVQMYQMVEIVG